METNVDASGMRWPAEFEPARSPVHAVNQLDMAAPPGAVWAVMLRAKDWPTWYANAKAVEIEGGRAELSAGARFTWKTFGVKLVSRVEEFVKGERIAWTAKGTGVWAYHAWLIRPAPAGCHVLTEETQHGVLAQAGKLLMPHRMERWHQRWLEGLAQEAATSSAVAGRSPTERE